MNCFPGVAMAIVGVAARDIRLLIIPVLGTCLQVQWHVENGSYRFVFGGFSNSEAARGFDLKNGGNSI